MKPRIAIIGAGISGLTLARNLVEDADVHVFEKARGVGGRMSTRHAEPFYFDHGTQFFTARSQAFQHFIAPMVEMGLIAPWSGNVITIQEDRSIEDRPWLEPHYVAVPHMNSLCKHLATGMPMSLSTELAPLQAKQADGWHLMDKEGKALGVFDWVISTAPPVQTKQLFGQHLQAYCLPPEPALIGCYTLMMGLNKPWDKPWMAAKVHANPIEWMAVNSTKPGRNSAITSIVAHSNNAWAQAHIDDDLNEIGEFLRKEVESISAIDVRDLDYFSCHRWRYALVSEPGELAPFFDSTNGLASTGDWCTASRIEEAWLNAMKLAYSVKADLLSKSS